MRTARSTAPHTLALLCVLIPLAASLTAATPQPFAGMTAGPLISTGAQPTSLVTADFNRDGIPDLAVANSADTTVTILLGNGDGTFSAANTTSGPDPVSLAVADINRDGVPDLIVANGGNDSISLLLGNGDGTFTPFGNLSGPIGLIALLAGDFNNDGISDIAAAGIGNEAQSSSIHLFLGNGDGTFATPITTPSGVGLTAIAAADLNADGRLDLAILTANVPTQTGTILIALGDGAGHFAIANAINAGGDPSDAAIADWNNDGHPDLAWTDSGNLLANQFGSIQLVPGAANLFAVTPVANSIPAGTEPLFLIAADLNGDGLPDIAVTNYDGVSLLPGNGDGTFRAPLNYPATSAYGLVTADFNGDHIPDLAVTNVYDDNVQILLGSPIPCSLSLSGATTIITDSTGGAFSLSVVAPYPTCGWTASTDSPWIALTPGSGTGSGTLNIQLPPNSTGVACTGAVSLAGFSIPVTEWSTAQTFNDVPPTASYFDGVNELAAKSITTGCSPDLYCPNNPVTRAQMAIFLVRAIYGSNTFNASETPYFADVPPGSFGFPYIQQLYELGLTTGCGNGSFCPNASVTRDQMAIFLIRLRYGATTTFPYPATPIFTDVPLSDFAFAWIQRLSLDGITSGCAPTLYCPTQPVTRAQMAMFLIRSAFNQLLPSTVPILTNLSPPTIPAGQSTDISVTGLNTHFSNLSAVTVPGMLVSGLTVQSDTSLTVTLTPIFTGTTPPPTSVVITTGTETAVYPLGLSIP